MATVLGRLFEASGHSIEQVYGRNTKTAAALAKQFNSTWVTDPTLIASHADLYLVAVSDNAIEKVCSQLHLGNQLIVHTAGSVSKEVLKSVSVEYGVFYPLQSLRSLAAKPARIPILVDASSTESIKKLQSLAHSIGSNFQVCNDEQRLQMHLAAVWVNNFPNVLYAIAYRICEEKGLDFSLLQPLISQTTERIDQSDPWKWQTGPAIRNDNKTVDIHRQMLSRHPDWLSLYQAMTKQIKEMSKLYSSG